MPHNFMLQKGDDFLHWLFATGTRVVEFLNTALLIGFTIPLIWNLEAIIASYPYTAVYTLGNPIAWGLMAILGLVQWFAMARKGIHSNQMSGYILILSGGAWTGIASLFLSRSEIVTPAPLVYLIIAFICLAAGSFLLRMNKKMEDMLESEVKMIDEDFTKSN